MDLAPRLLAFGALVALLVGCAPTAPDADDARSAHAQSASASIDGRASGAQSGDAMPSGVELPALDAASSGCAAMNGLLVAALATAPEGTAFTSAQKGQDSSADAWAAFVSAFAKTNAEELSAAASDDASRAAIAALDDYLAAQTSLTDGSLQEFADPAQAALDLKAGRTPEKNPAYQAALDSFNAAHVRLSECMPDWPVVF